MRDVLQPTEEQIKKAHELKFDAVEQMKLLRKEYSTAFKAVLTEEQLATFTEAKAVLPRHRKGDGTEESVDSDITDDAPAAVTV